MKVSEAIRARRSVRFFAQDPISTDALRELVEAARMAPSARNLQPLEYVIANDPQLVAQIFPTLAWAGYIQPRRDPPEGKRPVAYVVVLVNRELRTDWTRADIGAAIENLLLAAVEKGLGSCWLGSVDRNKVREILRLPESLEIDSVLALGKPAEQPVSEDAADSIKYYLDENDQLHVPKRPLQRILHENGYRSE